MSKKTTKSKAPKPGDIVFHKGDQAPITTMRLDKIVTKNAVKYGKCTLLQKNGVPQVDENGDDIIKEYLYKNLTTGSPLSGALGIYVF